MLKSKSALLIAVIAIGGLAAFIALGLSGARVRAQNAVNTVPEWQKAAGDKLSFEVASIRLANSGNQGMGRATANFPLDISDSLGNAGPSGAWLPKLNWPSIYNLPTSFTSHEIREMPFLPRYQSGFLRIGMQLMLRRQEVLQKTKCE